MFQSNTSPPTSASVELSEMGMGREREREREKEREGQRKRENRPTMENIQQSVVGMNEVVPTVLQCGVPVSKGRRLWFSKKH